MSDIMQDPGLVPGTRRSPIISRTLTSAPQDRSSEFVAVSGAQAETTSASVMLVTAYALFWALLLGFVWMTWRRQQHLANRLHQLESREASPNNGGGK
jgi:CcmD family protein